MSELKYGTDRFMIIYGAYEGTEKRAAELIYETVSRYVKYTLIICAADTAQDSDLREHNLILVGTAESNKILGQLLKKKLYKPCERAEGYSIKTAKSVYNPEKQMIIIAGKDERGVLYGAVDFKAVFLPFAENTHFHGGYFKNPFEDGLPSYERADAPLIKQRGFWTWGHVIYDYKRYIENMARLKLNTLIVWNDYVPVNIREVIDFAHSWGICVILGYSWGWDNARWDSSCGNFDLTEPGYVEQLENSIIEKYNDEHSELGIDGIYFQSFTETKEECRSGLLIADAVTQLVNRVSSRLLSEEPDIKLYFGLHATSVSNRLEYIKKTDERVTILWEDCGAFPYSYVPSETEGFDDTCKLTCKIVQLRGENDRTGAVLKGLTCLDWPSFENQQGSFLMGCHSKEFIRQRSAEKEHLWKYLEAYWLQNAKYAVKMIRLIAEKNKDAMITGLAEDGMLEEKMWFPLVLFSEMLWDGKSSPEELMCRAVLRSDTEF